MRVAKICRCRIVAATNAILERLPLEFRKDNVIRVRVGSWRIGPKSLIEFLSN